MRGVVIEKLRAASRRGVGPRRPSPEASFGDSTVASLTIDGLVNVLTEYAGKVVRDVLNDVARETSLSEHGLLEVFVYAQDYAARERRKETATADLDAPFVFNSQGELRTAQKVGIVPRADLSHPSERALLQRPADVDKAVEFALWWEDYYRFFDTFWPSGGRGIMLPGEENYPRLGLQPPLEFAGDQGVYALWLGRLSETETWRSQSFDDHLRTMRDLRKFVVETKGQGPFAIADALPIPTEILRRYGLVDKEVEMIERREGHIVKWFERKLVEEKPKEA